MQYSATSPQPPPPLFTGRARPAPLVGLHKQPPTRGLGPAPQRFRKLWNRGGYLAEGWIISGLCPPVGGSGRGGPREEERVFCRRRIIGRYAPGGARRFKLVHRLSWSPSVGVRRDRPEAGPSH